MTVAAGGPHFCVVVLLKSLMTVVKSVSDGLCLYSERLRVRGDSTERESVCCLLVLNSVTSTPAERISAGPSGSQPVQGISAGPWPPDPAMMTGLEGREGEGESGRGSIEEGRGGGEGGREEGRGRGRERERTGKGKQEDREERGRKKGKDEREEGGSGKQELWPTEFLMCQSLNKVPGPGKVTSRYTNQIHLHCFT